MLKCSIIIIYALLILLPGCGKEERPLPSRIDSLKTELKKDIDSLQLIVDRRDVHYSPFISKGRSSYGRLVRKYGEEGADIILAINRIDKKNLRRNDTLVVPDTIVNDLRFYSPFPLRIEDLENINKIFFVDQRIQAFAAYEYGYLVRWGPTSTGKKSSPTPNGLFHTNWKAKETISTINEEWFLKWAFNISNFEGVSIHEYEMPGIPESHSCVRLLAIDAKWFYYWGEQWIVTVNQENIVAYGTPVIILGEYQFYFPQPWKELHKNPSATNIPPDELEDQLDEFLDTIIDRQNERDSVIARKLSKFVTNN